LAYIGTKPTIGNFQICDAISVVNGQAAYTMQVGGVNVSPQSSNHMIVSLNGTIQKPGGANPSFTVSGSTITFASNLATGDVIDFIQILGDVLDLGVPSDATVTTAKIGANAVTAAKLNNDIISGSTELASEPADTDEFLVSDAGTLKRIDYSHIKSDGGCWTHLLTSTASNSSSIDFNSTYITSTYLDYMIIGTNIKLATNATHMSYLVSEDNGSTINASNYYNVRRGHDSDNDNRTLTQNGGSSGGYFTPDEIGNNTGEVANFTTIFYDPMKQSGTASRYLGFNTNGQAYTDHPRLMTFQTSSSYAGSVNAINFIRLSALSGNITSGKVSLYGRKVS
jgi:hypothetical protein